METKIRKQAIERYIKGESPKSIYTDLDRSKNWFFKCLRRYKSGDAHNSKAPKHSPSAINTVDKQRINATRRQLESQKFAQIGASAFLYILTIFCLSGLQGFILHAVTRLHRPRVVSTTCGSATFGALNRFGIACSVRVLWYLWQ